MLGTVCFTPLFSLWLHTVPDQEKKAGWELSSCLKQKEKKGKERKRLLALFLIKKKKKRKKAPHMNGGTSLELEKTSLLAQTL